MTCSAGNTMLCHRWSERAFRPAFSKFLIAHSTRNSTAESGIMFLTHFTHAKENSVIGVAKLAFHARGGVLDPLPPDFFGTAPETRDPTLTAVL
jgi:hypothetical protein